MPVAQLPCTIDTRCEYKSVAPRRCGSGAGNNTRCGSHSKTLGIIAGRGSRVRQFSKGVASR